MDIEPRGKSLASVDVNKDQDSWQEDTAKYICHEGSTIPGKIIRQPPKEKRKAGDE